VSETVSESAAIELFWHKCDRCPGFWFDPGGDAWVKATSTEPPWHPAPHVGIPERARPAPGEYLVLYRSGRMVSASWKLTTYAPEGEWVDDWDGDSIEDFDGQVVTHWRVLPAGLGKVSE
jgi:hypothetical protein